MTRPTHDGTHSKCNLRPFREDVLINKWQTLTKKGRAELRASIEALYNFHTRFGKAQQAGCYKWQLDILDEIELQRQY